MRKWINLVETRVNEAENETLVIDLPMLKARGIKRLLDRCVNSALGNLAYREENVPLRRRYIVKGDHRVISMLRSHLGTRLDERAQVPATSYGYWIKPDGEALPVESAQHLMVLRKTSSIHFYTGAYEQGWIRCVLNMVNFHRPEMGKSFIIQTDTGIISARAMATISTIAREHDTMAWSGEIAGEYQRFTQMAPFLAFVQSKRQRMPARERELELTEGNTPLSLIDVANHFLDTRDDLLDPDEDMDDLTDADALVIIKREYLSGTCAAYAVALHDKTGYPIVGINGGMHVAVQAPDGEIVDFLGKAPLKKVLRRYGMTGIKPVLWSREETVEHVRMAGMEDHDYDSDPWDEINIAKWVLGHRSNLNEAWFSTLSNGSTSYDVAKNPTRGDLAKMLKLDPIVRAWLTGTDLFAFPASQVIHSDTEAYLPVDYRTDARIYLDAQGPYLDADSMMADVMFCPEEDVAEMKKYTPVEFEIAERWKALIANHPSLNRLYGTYELRKK